MIDTRDTSSLDALESLVISDGWGLIAQRIRDMIESTRDDLERCQSEWTGMRSVPWLQGQVSALRTVLGLPAILKAEMEAEMKK